MATVRSQIRRGGAKGLPRSMDAFIDAVERSYAQFSMAANMGAGVIAGGNHVQFDTIVLEDGSGDIVVSTGVDQAKGAITLKAGKVYELRAGISCGYTGITGVTTWQFRDVTNSVNIGNQMETLANLNVAATSNGGICSVLVDTLAGDRVVNLRMVADTAMDAVHGEANAGGRCWVTVVQIA